MVKEGGNIMNIEEKMQFAIEQARLSLLNNELPVGAVIFHGDDIISTGYSSGESRRIFLQHAEMKALLDADAKQYPVKMRKEMQLFVTLEPCMMCLGAAMSFFVGEIYYALEAPIDGAANYAKQFHNIESEELPSYRLPKMYSGVLRKQSLDLLREFIEVKNSGPMYEFCKSLLSLENE